ncbi:hypothetical protein RDABS01_023891 [Bienertia sinuspersici]
MPLLSGETYDDGPFSGEAMKNTLKIAWRLGKGMVVREINRNMFIFQFFSMMNKMKVMEDGPCSFGGVPLLLKEIEEGIDKPLRRFMIIAVPRGSKLVTFTYERLVDICNACGCLSHGFQQCAKFDGSTPASELPSAIGFMPHI